MTVVSIITNYWFFGFKLMQAKQADGARRSVRDVLQYLIAIPEVKDTIKKDGSKIKLRFAADGRRTSKRIGTVMAVFNILCENKATYEYQYTLALYNGKCRDSNILTFKCLSPGLPVQEERGLGAILFFKKGEHWCSKYVTVSGSIMSNIIP